MGHKKLFWFSKSLAAKNMWRLIHNDMLWGRVLVSKYISSSSILEWIRSPRKIVHNSSI
jgi:hypothetical protein